MNFRELVESTPKVKVDSSIAVKGLTGKVKEMIEWMEDQKGWSHSSMFEKGSEFEIFFENSKQALKIVRLANDKFGYYTKELGNNGRIVEIMLNDAGLNESVKVKLNDKGQNVYLEVGKESITINAGSDRQKIVDNLTDLGVDVDKNIEKIITKALIIAGDR